MTVLRLPQFIIGGAPRSGTQWLYATADRHPDIAMAKPLVPEPKFFLRDDLYERGLAYYSATWFKDIPPGKIAGEKSTNYLESPVAARRIHESLPDVKLVFILRNPVDRAYSNYLWSRQNGLESESFEAALEREADRELSVSAELAYARPHALFSRGVYVNHLRPYFSLFGPDRILVLRFEDIAREPGGIAQTLHEFLGVAPRPHDADAGERINAAKNDQGLQMDPQTRRHLAARYSDANAALCRMLGPAFKGWNG